MTITYTPPPQLPLSPISPDYVGTFNQIMTDLVAGGYWTDLSQSATGVTLVRWLASVSAFGQGSIARAIQENYPDTARSPSGIFRGVRLQGVHIIRSRPGVVSTTVTRTDSLTSALVIPALTQWSIGGQSFYNANPITLAGTGISASAILTRGQIQSATYTASGSKYQLYILGNPGAWNISDGAISAIDSTGVIWSSTRTGLWKYGATDCVFFESTLPDGTVECKFGDGTYGAIPPAGSITFYYIVLATAAATAVGLSTGSTGAPVGYMASAVTTSEASTNQDPPPPDFYKAVGPGGPANKGRAVTRDDHRAIALQYPGVIDALFQGQAENNPSDLRWMNVLTATLLTTSPWTQIEWLAFKQYFEGSKAIATTKLTRKDPVPVPVVLTIDIAIFANASVTSVTSLAQQVIATYFAPSASSLGTSLEPSDLPLAIMESATFLQAPGESGELIDYIRVRSPPGPVTVGALQYLILDGMPTLNVFYTRRGVSAAANGSVVGL